MKAKAGDHLEMVNKQVEVIKKENKEEVSGLKIENKEMGESLGLLKARLDAMAAENALLKKRLGVLEEREEKRNEEIEEAADSKILKREEKVLLMKYVGNAKLEMLHSASKHWFAAASFHKNCDNKGATITIVESNLGNVFGGYTSLSWISSEGYKSDSTAWIFVVRSKSNRVGKWKCTNSGSAVWDGASYNPVFGNGHDFVLYSDCNTNTHNYSKPGVAYGCPKDNTLLAGANKFLVKDFEVCFLFLLWIIGSVARENLLLAGFPGGMKGLSFGLCLPSDC